MGPGLAALKIRDFFWNLLLEGMLAKGIEPSTVRLQVGRSTIELHQHDSCLTTLAEFPD